MCDHDNVAVAVQYLAALEAGGDIAHFFTDDVVQIEFPNQLVKEGATRDLATLLAGHERGKQVMLGQQYKIIKTVAAADTVVLEVDWSGTLAIDIGSLVAGDVMRAKFAVFLDFRDSKICAQRNYDCFEPF